MRALAYSSADLTWNDDTLYFGKRPVAKIVPDKHWPNMWRVQLPNGKFSDMTSRTRAKDAACSLANQYDEQNPVKPPAEAA